MFSDGLNPAKRSPVRGLQKKKNYKKKIILYLPGREKMRQRKLKGFSLSLQVR